MQQPTEIIVYRNPLEAQMYHALGTGGFFILLCAMLAGFVFFLIANRLMEKFVPRGFLWKHREELTWVLLGASFAFACGVAYIM